MDASTKDVLRQTTIDATPRYTPVARTLTFPSYAVPESQRLLLQLEVAAFERRPVMYGLAHAQPEHTNLALNGVPDAGSGPLAFVHQVTSSGLRAALHGQPEARVQLILALALTGLTALANPRLGTRGVLRRAATAGKRLVRQATVWRRRLAGPNRESDPGGAPTVRGRAFAAPWYPWVAAVIPILHHLASNSLHFTVRQVLVPVGGVLLLVTVAVAGLWLVVRSWHRAAAAVTGVAAVVFTYGHVERALDGLLDYSVLFPSPPPVIAAAAIWIAVRSQDLVVHGTKFVNLTVVILLAFQIMNLAGGHRAFLCARPNCFPRPLQTLANIILTSTKSSWTHTAAMTTSSSSTIRTSCRTLKSEGFSLPQMQPATIHLPYSP